MDNTDNSSTWEYMREGRHKLVLRDTKKRCVVYVEPAPATTTTPSTKHDIDDNNNNTAESWFEAICYDREDELFENMRRALGPQFVLRPRAVPTPSNLGVTLAGLRNHTNRLSTTHLDDTTQLRVSECHDATFLPDQMAAFCDGDTLTVEIKAKLGFVPLAADDGEASGRNLITPSCGRKCLKSDVRTVSTYCPCDLFSGCRARMAYALRGLIKQPERKFVCFSNGKPVYPSVSGDGKRSSSFFDDGTLASFLGLASSSDACTVTDVFLELVINALLSEPTVIDGEAQAEPLSHVHLPKLSFNCQCWRLSASGDESDTSVGDSNSHLPKGCVLFRLLYLQRLHYLNEDELDDLFRRLVETWRTLSSGKDVEVHKNGALGGHHQCAMPNRTVAEMQGYMQSVTGRNCSIMIAFQKPRIELLKTLDGSINAQLVEAIKSRILQLCSPLDDMNSPHRTFLYNITVIDIDRKPITCIPKRAAVDRRLFSMAEKLIGLRSITHRP